MISDLKPTQLSVLVVGLGKVAIGYDLDVKTELPKTHLFSLIHEASAKNIHLNFTAVEPIEEVAGRAKSAIPTLNMYRNLVDIERGAHFDLAINCVPIKNAASVTLDILDRFDISLLILEKPGAINQSEAIKLNSQIANHPSCFIVYPRRALPSTNFLKELIRRFPNSNWTVSIQYSGSQPNILSHFVDFTEYIFQGNEAQPLDQEYSLDFTQTADVNRNDHKILLNGPITIHYEAGGCQITIRDTTGVVERIDASMEITSQIYFTVREYLGHFIYGKKLRFPHQISENIISILEEK